MRRSALISSLCVVCLTLPAVAAAQPSAAQTAERLGSRIATGTAESRTNVAYGLAVGVVEAPTDVVMRIITDYDRYSEFLPHFRQSRVLSRRGNNALVYMQASVIRSTATLWAQVRIFARRPRGEMRIIEGRMVTGNMDQFVARWEVTPLDGGSRTLVRFRILVEPDLPFPGSIFTSENVKAARQTIAALRQRTSEPRYARNP